jgi:RNA polymerase sigma-70 factor, ECF subfamily
MRTTLSERMDLAGMANFSAVVRPHLDYLVGRARHILGSEDLAWDAVQETLLTLWREGRPPCKLRGWLIRAVIHRSLHLRRTCNRRRKHEEGAGVRQQNSDRDDPVRDLAIRELSLGLERALAGLANEYRVVFLLREVEGLDYSSIAGLLRIPLGTVQSRLNRARSALRALLGPEFQAAHDCWLCGSREHAPARCPSGRRSVEN